MVLSASAQIVAAAQYLHFTSLGLNPVLLNLGFFQIRWYALAYITGILLAWGYLNRLLAQPNAPMAKRHAEDLVFYATLGVILGGRLGYALFYKPEMFLQPAQLLHVWEGGMSFHGGALGVLLAMTYLAWRNKLNLLRVVDYVSCGVPIGLFLGRLANFVNGELWGRHTTVAWAMIFPEGILSRGQPGFPGFYEMGTELPRHPSQLYEAGLEGLVLFALLAALFWRTDARLRPGRLSGVFIGGYGLARFIIEYFREPDEGVALILGMSRGQILCLPMVLVGALLIAWSFRKRGTAAPRV